MDKRHMVIKYNIVGLNEIICHLELILSAYSYLCVIYTTHIYCYLLYFYKKNINGNEDFCKNINFSFLFFLPL